MEPGKTKKESQCLLKTIVLTNFRADLLESEARTLSKRLDLLEREIEDLKEQIETIALEAPA